MNIRDRLRLFAAASLLLLTAIGAPAQVSTASLSGLITDPSQGRVSGAKVSVANKATGLTRETTSDASGYYTFPTLPIGAYTVTVAATGFDRVDGVATLATAEKARQDFQLRVGTAQQSITVAAQAPELSHDDASLGTVIGNTTVRETPLYLRNWDDLLRLVPGVQAQRYTDQNGATSAGRTGGFNVHGIHSLQNNFLLDGVDNNTFSENVQELSAEASRPSVDNLEEFKVLTNPYSAEYGRSPGAAVSVTTKSGTNDWHLLAYEYLRNQYFDANDFFSNRNRQVKPQNNQNQFGANIGAPIVRNKLFGFFNFEGTRIHRGVLRTATVPLANDRLGDFSPAAAAQARVSYPTIYDPLSGLPFANNQVPQGRLDPYAVKILNLFPLPNLPGQLNNFTRNAGLLDNNDAYDGRVDWVPSQSDNLFVRYSYSTRFRFIPGNFGGIADGTSTSAFGRQNLTAHSAVIGWTHTFSPALVNEFRAGFTRNLSFAQQDPFGKNHTSDYVPGVPQNPAVDGGVSQTSFANLGSIGSPDFLPKSQIPQQFQYIDTLSWVAGRHSLKFGADIRAPMRNIFQDEPGTRGSLGFDRIFTCQRGSNSQCVGNTGFSYADALLGYVRNAQLTNVYFVDQRIHMLSGFVQDDYKVTPKLTLNLGLRYDFASPALEGRNRQANFDPNGNGGAGSVVFASDKSLRDRALVQINRNNWGPRLGFAYSPAPSTVIRGGYGIYYTLFERYGSENQLGLNPPFLINNVLSVASTSPSPVFLLRSGFPSNFLDPSQISYQRVRIRAEAMKLPTPYVQQWSLGFQQTLPFGFTGELNYVGTKSTHLDVLTDLNQPISGVAPYPGFGYVEFTSAGGSGTYHGLEASLLRRFSRGVSLRAAYTFSHSIDNAPEELSANSGAAPNGRDTASWRGSSDFDIRHRLVLNALYELPFGRGKAFLSHGILSYVFGNIRISTVYTYSSGRPFTVNSGGSLGSAIDPYGAATAVPFVVGSPRTFSDPNCWFYVAANGACRAKNPSGTDAFRLQSPGQFGNAGRNIVTGPSQSVLDASLLKEFPIRERANAELRWEVFNVLNTALFGQPSGNFSNSAAGTITSLAGDPRVMQLALRVSF